MPVTDERRVDEQPVPSTEQDLRQAAPSRRRAIVLCAFLALGALVVIGIVLLAGRADNPPAPASKAAAPAAKQSAAGSAAATVTPARRVGVTLREFIVSPRPTVGRAGRVTFAVRNDGAVPHEFVVLRTRTAAAGLLKGDEADESGNVGEIGDIQPGQAKALKLKLTPGHYALICNLPGHYQAGQHADFTVK